MKLSALLAEVWAIHEPALEQLVAKLATAPDAASLEAAARMFSTGASRVRRDGDVGHVQVRGVLVRGRADYYMRWLGMTGLDDIRDDLSEALADDSVKSIVLEVESPGGTAIGLQAVAEAIREARGRKRVDAFVTGMAASAGYYLAAQAERIVAEGDAIVGSIGTFARVVDSSEAAARDGYKVHIVRFGAHKGMGTPGAPVTPEQLAMHQALVNDLGAQFIDAVAAGRGLERDRVATLATGAHWLATVAQTLGLVDAVGGAGALKTTNKRGNVRAEEDPMSTPNASTTTPAPTAAAAPTPPPAPAPAGPQAATIGELKARFPGESEFVLAQLEAKATIEQANNAFVSVKLERAEKERDALKAQLAAAPKAAAPAPAGKPAGVDPIVGQSTTAHDTPLAKSGDFVSQARERAKEKGISYTAAATELAAENPELHAAYVDKQHDDTKARQRRGGRK